MSASAARDSPSRARAIASRSSAWMVDCSRTSGACSGEGGDENVDRSPRIPLGEVEVGDGGAGLAPLAVLVRELGQRRPGRRHVAEAQLSMHQQLAGQDDRDVRSDELRLVLLDDAKGCESLVKPAPSQALHPPREVDEKRLGGLEIGSQGPFGPRQPVLRLLEPALVARRRRRASPARCRRSARPPSHAPRRWRWLRGIVPARPTNERRAAARAR